MLISFAKLSLTGMLFLVTSMPVYALPELVFRATGKIDDPESVKRANGLYARGIDGSRRRQPPPNISLFDHATGALTGTSRADSGYVSTTRLRRFAFSFLSRYMGNNGYIYHIRPSPNFYDVNGTLGRFSPHPPEQEFAALGHIEFNQIIGWETVNNGVSAGFINNPDYRERLYSPVPTNDGIEYRLAGFPPNHIAWTREPWRSESPCSSQGSPIRSTDTCDKNSAHTIGEDAFHRHYKLKVSRQLNFF